MDIKTIEAADVAPAAGHYSHAIRFSDLIFVSGQFGRDDADPDPAAAPPGLQAKRCLDAISRILHAAGSDLSRVIKLTLYVTDIAFWPEVDQACAEILRDHRPARAVVPVPALHYGFKVEIDAVAAAADIA